MAKRLHPHHISHVAAITFVSLAALAVGIGFAKYNGAVVGGGETVFPLGIIAVVAALVTLGVIAFRKTHHK